MLDLGILESMSEGVTLHDAADHLVAANTAAERILGRPRAELVGLSCAQLLDRAHGRDRQPLAAEDHPVRAVLDNGRPLLAQRICLHGTRHDRRWLQVNAVPLGAGHALGDARVMLTFSDVTEQMRTEDALRQSEQRFAAVFRNSEIGIAISRSDGVFVEVNEAFLRIFGYQRAEMIGHSAIGLDIWVDIAQRTRMFERLDREGIVSGFEFQVRRKDGDIGTLSMDARLVPLEGQDHMIALVRDISENLRLTALVQDQAYRDPLTQVANRRLLHDRLAQALLQSRRSGRLGGLLLIDLDHFKQVNEAFGHAFGDRLLVEAARRLDAEVGSEDTVARFGGDEFVVLIQSIDEAHGDPINQLREIADRIRTALTKPYNLGEAGQDGAVEGQVSSRFSASIGVTLITGKEADGEVALRHADHAMYRAKREGRDCIRFFVGWRLQPS